VSATAHTARHQFPLEVQQFLHAQLRYIRDEAQLYRRKFNFALLAEEAHQRFGQPFHRNSLRRFALRHGYYQRRPEEKSKVYIRFEMPGPGILFQHDASRHCWLPTLGGQQYLLLTQDDYSRRVVGALLVPRETSWTHLLVVRQTVFTYGRPLAYYVDNHSIFRWVTHQSYRYTVTTAEDDARVQFRRVLRGLEIGIIHSAKGEPAARGKIEKRFDYFQRRLPFLCEKYRVREFGDANRILGDAVAYYNDARVHLETGEIPTRRWEEAIATAQDRLRPLPADVDVADLFSLHLERTVGKDGTFPFLGQRWPLDRMLHRHRVQLRWIPEERLWVLQGGRKVGDFVLDGNALQR
jgi:transposase InsO family protein